MRAPLVVKRALDEPLLLLAALGSILLATTTLVALTMYASSIAGAGVRRALETASYRQTTTTISAQVDARTFPAYDRMVRDELAAAFGAPPGVTTSLRSDSYVMPGQDGEELPELLRFGSHDGLDRHARLVEGTWPRTGGQVVEAAISERAAEATGFEAGREFVTKARLDGSAVRVRVVGVFRLDDPVSGRWAGEELLSRGVERGEYTTYGPLMVTQETFAARFATGVRAVWAAEPDLGALTPERLGPLAQAVGRVGERLAAAGCVNCLTAGELPALLTQLGTASLVARSTMLIPVLQLLLLAGYALMLTARLLADHRRMEVALLRSRGAGAARLAALAGSEALLVAVPCAVVAPLLGPPLLALVGLLPWIRSSGAAGAGGGRGDVPRLVRGGAGRGRAAGAAGRGGGAAYVRGGAVGARARRAARPDPGGGRGSGAAGGGRAGDLAAPALRRARHRDGGGRARHRPADHLRPGPGAARGRPAGAAAGAARVAAGRAADLAPAHARARAGRLAGQQAAAQVRGPRAAADPGRRDRRHLHGHHLHLAGLAARPGRSPGGGRPAAVGPVRGPELGALGRGTAFTALPGVTAASPAFRAPTEVGGQSALLLALDAGRLPELFRLRRDLSELTVAQLSAALPGDRAGRLELPGRPRTLTVRAESRAAAPARLVLSDALGVWRDLPLGELRLGGNRIELDLTPLAGRAGTIAYPLSVRGLVAGDESGLRLTGLSVDGRDVPGADGQDGDGRDVPVTGAVALPHGVVGFGPAREPRSLPVVLTSGLAATLKLNPGQEGSVRFAGRVVRIEVVGLVASMPTSAPDQQGVLADWETLQAYELAAAQPSRAATEWWLATTGSAAAREILRSNPQWDVTAVDRRELAATLRDDPLAGALQGGLTLGFAAALGFAVLGFLVNAVVAARERRAEFAVLRALGAGSRQLFGMLATEQAFVIGLSLAAGTGLAVVVGNLVVPRIVLTGQASAVTPGVLFHVPWASVAAMLALVTLVLVAIVAGLARRMWRGRTLEER
ncbi:ABC transporter permease [Nonomuraea rubra]|uniref:ABC transporter permease n=1 Tax=Nonomuraea rubra TaxID=46180 RepID=UPI00361CA38C